MNEKKYLLRGIFAGFRDGFYAAFLLGFLQPVGQVFPTRVLGLIFNNIATAEPYPRIPDTNKRYKRVWLEPR